jgi:DNA repair ATPase RecN
VKRVLENRFLIDALMLALGGRADASVMCREGASKADIAAEFTGEFDSAVLSWLEDTNLRRKMVNYCCGA